jgi:hypothetical protein
MLRKRYAKIKLKQKAGLLVGTLRPGRLKPEKNSAESEERILDDIIFYCDYCLENIVEDDPLLLSKIRVLKSTAKEKDKKRIREIAQKM